jgi:hypothetical protein
MNKNDLLQASNIYMTCVIVQLLNQSMLMDQLVKRLNGATLCIKHTSSQSS